MNSDSESSITLKLVKKLKDAGVKGINTEFVVNQGRIDLITEYEIIEIKIANLWKGALGQVLSYGKDPKVSMLNKRIHLFGNMRVRKYMIEDTCNHYGVSVSYEDEVEDWCDSDIEYEQSITCNFCDKELSSNSSLKLHQTKTKYCLEKQRVLNGSVSIPKIECIHCGKIFIHKHRKNTHEENCDERIMSNSISKTQEILKLKEEILNLKAELKSEREKSSMYINLFNKEHEFTLGQCKKLSEKQSVTTNNIWN